MIDTDSGKLAYAVLSFGGILGLVNKLFAAPWALLTVDGEKKQLVRNVSKQRLKDARDSTRIPGITSPSLLSPSSFAADAAEAV